MRVRIEIEIPNWAGDSKSDLDAYVGQFIVYTAQEIEMESYDAVPAYTIVEDADEDTY